MSNPINKRSLEDRAILKNKTVYGMPDNPSNKGFSADQIKKKIADPALILFDWLMQLTEEAYEAYDALVEKETGKGLSANDFTDLLKAKLDAIEEQAQVNIIESITINGNPVTITDKNAAFDFDVAGYIPLTEKDNFEKVANKVVAINQSSTDTQYPSAKCVYDNVQDVREVAAGKCANYSLSYAATKPSPSLYSSYYYVDNDGEVVKFTSYDEMNTYESGTLVNSSFNSTADSFYFTPYNSTDILIFTDRLGRNIIAQLNYLPKLFKLNDNILITETQVPDRWISSVGAFSIIFNKLETAKMSDYYSKSESLLPTSSGTYNIGGNGATWNDGFFDGSVHFGEQLSIRSNPNNASILEFVRYSAVLASLSATAFYPGSNKELGTSTQPWTNGYFNGDLNIGSGKIWYNSSLFVNDDFCASSNAVSLGKSSAKWGAVWTETLKGATTMTQAQYDALVSGGTVDSETFYFIEEE